MKDSEKPRDIIGLRRGTVRLVDHEPGWAELFEREAGRIREQIGNIVDDIQHIGSTAVPDLSAKPILDIAIAVQSRDAIGSVVEGLCKIGYIDRGDGGQDGGYLLVWECEPDVRTAHIHIVEETDRQWRDYITFRDTLRADQDMREKYAMLKRALLEQYRNDRKSYTAGKHRFIRGFVGER